MTMIHGMMILLQHNGEKTVNMYNVSIKAPETPGYYETVTTIFSVLGNNHLEAIEKCIILN